METLCETTYHTFPQIIVEARVESPDIHNQSSYNLYNIDKKSSSDIDDTDSSWDCNATTTTTQNNNNINYLANTYLKATRSTSISPKPLSSHHNLSPYPCTDESIHVLRPSPTSNALLLDVSPANLSYASSSLLLGNSPGYSRAVSPFNMISRFSNSPHVKNRRSYSQPSEYSTCDNYNQLGICQCDKRVFTMSQNNAYSVNRKYSLNNNYSFGLGNSPNIMSNTSSGFDLILESQTLQSKFLHALNSKKFKLTNSQSVYDLRTRQYVTERKISLPTRFEDSCQVNPSHNNIMHHQRRNSRRIMSRKKSISSIKHSSNYFGVIEVPYQTVRKSSGESSGRQLIRKTSGDVGGLLLAAPIIRSKSKNLHYDEKNRKSDLSNFLSSTSSSELPASNSLKCDNNYCEENITINMSERRALTPTCMSPHMANEVEMVKILVDSNSANGNNKIFYCRLFVLLVTIQILVGSSMSILGIYLWNAEWNLTLVECSHWAAIPLLLIGLANLFVYCSERRLWTNHYNLVKYLKLKVAILSLSASVLCMTSSIFSGHLSDQIGVLISENCTMSQSDCCCPGVRNFTNIKCDLVQANLKDYLILQCALLGLASGVSLWLCLILIRKRKSRLLDDEDERDEGKKQSAEILRKPSDLVSITYPPQSTVYEKGTSTIPLVVNASLLPLATNSSQTISPQPMDTQLFPTETSRHFLLMSDDNHPHVGHHQILSRRISMYDRTPTNIHYPNNSGSIIRNNGQRRHFSLQVVNQPLHHHEN